MEIVPHLYIGNYESYQEKNIIKKKKIKVIIHISKRKKFLDKEKIEELRIPIEFDEQEYDLEHVNLELYSYLHDMIEFVHEKIKEGKPVLILGYSHKQELDTFACAYYIKYGKVTPKLAIYYLKTKKNNIFLPESIYEYCLEKYYEDQEKRTY